MVTLVVLALVVLALVVLVLVVGGLPDEKTDILITKNLEIVVYYNFGAFGAVYTFLAPKALFFLFNFSAFRRFLKCRKSAEDAVYYQFWRRRHFVKTLCIVL